MRKSTISVNVKRGRGRPATGVDPAVSARLPIETITQLDAWAKKQPDKPSRSVAIRRLVSMCLAEKPPRDPSRTTPMGMIRYALEYNAAALLADKGLGFEDGYERRAPTVVYFLIGHAIELALKAYLLQLGMPLGKVITLGHDLKRCLKEAEKLGLGTKLKILDIDRPVLQILNNLYATKQLEYIETGSKQYPTFGLLQTFSDHLLRAVITAIPSAEGLLHRKTGQMLGAGNDRDREIPLVEQGLKGKR